MATRTALILLLGMLAPAGSAAAQAASDGISWECTTEVKFLLPGPYGALPVFKSPLDRKRPHRRWDPAVQGPETIEATAVVGADGAIRDLRVYWMQSGLMGGRRPAALISTTSRSTSPSASPRARAG